MEDQFFVNDEVDVNGQRAIVRYVDIVQFAPGIWIGVELDSPSGKNDGSVQGVAYFSCPDRHGMFVKPSVPRLMKRGEPTRRVIGGGGHPLQQPSSAAAGSGAATSPAIRPPSRTTTSTPSGIRPPSRTATPLSGKRFSIPASGSSSPVPGGKARSMTLRVRPFQNLLNYRNTDMVLQGPSKSASPTKGHFPSASASGLSTPRTATPTLTRPPALRAGGPSLGTGRTGSMGPPSAKPITPQTQTNSQKRQFIGSTGFGGSSLSRTGSSSAGFGIGSGSTMSNTTPRNPNRLSLRPVGTLTRGGSVDSNASQHSDSGLRRAVTDAGRRSSLGPRNPSTNTSARTSPSRMPGARGGGGVGGGGGYWC
jgi:hypothetical protein